MKLQPHNEAALMECVKNGDSPKTIARDLGTEYGTPRQRLTLAKTAHQLGQQILQGEKVQHCPDGTRDDLCRQCHHATCPISRARQKTV